ncbi:MAG: glutathione S-transferase [Oceanospirillaceae bacterium]|jgi:glutathione S-transferase
MPNPILYSFRRCPFAMRARLAIHYTGTQVELREVVLKNKPQQLLDISPKATVPVLDLGSAGVIDESLDIMLWALAQRDTESWLAKKAPQMTLITECDLKFKACLDKYKYADRHPEHSMLYYREQCCEFLQKLEQQLSANTFLFAQEMRLADAAIFPFIRQFAHVDRNWFFQSEFVNVQAWITLLINSLVFQGIMNKYNSWDSTQKGIAFPV